MARSLSRFFIEGSQAQGAWIILDPSDARKVRNVLRLQDGDAIEAIDSTGTAYRAVLAFEPESVKALLGEAIDRATEPSLRLVLAQGIPKGQKMDFVVEKTTELGVAAIVPFFSARTAGERVGGAKLERWRRLARTAAAQSGRRVVPEIAEPVGWDALLDRFDGFDRVLLAWEVAEPSALRERLPALLDGARSVCLIIGPEGGLTHDEVAAAAGRGAEVIRLGARILRTETAGLVACAALLTAVGEI